MKRLALLILLTLLSACSLPQPATMIRNYVPGELQTAAIGEPIFDVQRGITRRGFVALASHDPRMPGTSKVEQGRLYRVTRNLGRIGGGGYFLTLGNRLLVITEAGVVQGVVDEENGVLAPGGTWPDSALFKPADQVSGTTGFRSQMIYSGMEGNSVMAVYREFAGDFIRPAFSQELRYDLGQSRTIGYRTIQIEVVNATNSALEYRVLSDGGLPWLP